MGALKDWMGGMLAGFFGRDEEKSGETTMLVAGTVIALVAFPLLVIAFSRLVIRRFGTGLRKGVEGFIALVTIPLGLALLGWATWVFWRIGSGTPVPMAGPRELVTEGPYAHIRNPIQLGMMLYVLGLGTRAVNLPTGLVAASLTGVLGAAYHALIEERDLARRYGDDYLVYRQSTPFLVPQWRSLTGLFRRGGGEE